MDQQRNSHAKYRGWRSEYRRLRFRLGKLLRTAWTDFGMDGHPKTISTELGDEK